MHTAQHFHYPFLKCTPSAFVKSIGNHLTQRIKIIGLLKSICPQRPKQYLWEEIVSKIEFLRGKKGHLWRKFEITSFMKRCPTIYNFTCLLYVITKHIHFKDHELSLWILIEAIDHVLKKKYRAPNYKRAYIWSWHHKTFSLMVYWPYEILCTLAIHHCWEKQGGGMEED